MSEKRENWGSKLGLVLAMAGNAVGLGNFWRFPYMIGKYGGGAFMVPYIFALIALGLPLMMVEWNLGREGGKYGHGTLGPMIYLQAREGVNPKTAAIIGALAGMLAFGVTVLVNSYYIHIIGWTLGYAYESITGGYMGESVNTGAFFVGYIQDPVRVFIFWILALGSLGYAVMRGIQEGIEAWAKFMMPVLYICGFILIARTLTLGAPVQPDWTPIKGLDFIWTPRWEQLNWSAAIAAAGQIFFTLSIGMGIICNYASYLKPDDDIILAGVTTVSLNELAEVILGGTIAIPIAYTFMGEKGLASGVGLSFISLPNIFKTMGGGQFFGACWFFLLFFAGFTSAIAMYNYLTALLEEEAGIARKKASWFVFALYILVGLPVCLEPILTKTDALAYFTEIDNWVGSYLLVVLGLLEAVVIGWITKDKALEDMNRGSYWKVPKWFFRLFVQFITPVSAAVMIIFSTIDYIKAGYLKLIPSFVEKTPQLVPWVNAARLVILVVFAIGFTQAYRAIKKKYGQELATGKTVVRM